MNEKAKYFPILIDLSKFKALVVGGGKVATRKVRNLLDFGGAVTVISPEISDKLTKHEADANIKVIKREYQSGDAEGYNLVFSAADDLAVNEMLKADCDRLGVLLNAADVPKDCNFIMPATISRGDLTISVGSQGKAPFFVRHMRKSLERNLSPFLKEITELASYFRDKMLESGDYHDLKMRKDMIRKFVHTDWEKVIYNGGLIEARKMTDEILENKAK